MNRLGFSLIGIVMGLSLQTSAIGEERTDIARDTTAGVIAIANLDAEIAQVGTSPGVEDLLLARARYLADYDARTAHIAGGSTGCQRLVDRAKLTVASDLGRRWTLAEVAAEVRCSPVYLTQVFQQVEGIPLYRYQLRLRLARALNLLEEYDDLTQLSLDLGFSSHSHFSAAFRETYGKSPSAFKQSALGR